MTQKDLEISQAKPMAFKLPQGRLALLIIDMQRDFVQEGGFGDIQCPSKDIFNEVSRIIEPCKQALDAARALGMTVIHTREGHHPDLRDLAPSKKIRQYNAKPENFPLLIGDEGPMGRLLVRGEYGHDIIDTLTPWENEIILDKPGKGSFYNTDIHHILVSRGITHLLLAGVTTECCVATTFREANDHGFECCTIEECTAGFNNDIYKQSINTFCAYDGLFGYLGNVQELIALADKYPGSLGTPETDSKMNIFKLLKTNQLEDGAKKGNIPSFYGIPFMVDETIKSSANVVSKVIAKGGKFLGSKEDLDSVLNEDTVTFTLSVDKIGPLSFTPSSGLITLHDTIHNLYSSITITAKSVDELRYIYANLRGFDEQDEVSKMDYQFPITHLDFRSIEQSGFTFGSKNDVKYSYGTKIPFDWTFFDNMAEFTGLLNSESNSSFQKFQVLKRQFETQFFPADSPDVIICDQTKANYDVIRLLGIPSVSVKDLILAAPFGMDHVVLSVAKTF